jgi:hypothetical protein
MTNRSLATSSLLIAAAIPAFIVLFSVAGAMGGSAAGDPARAAAFFHDQAPLAAGIFLNSIVMHLAVVALAIGLFLRSSGTSPAVAAIGAALGVSWGILDIAQSSVTYSASLSAPAADAATVDAIAKGLQNAAHLGGGLWVLSLVWVAPVFGRAHRAVGVAVGAVFALHPLVVPLMPAWWALEYLGLPIWFGWTGLVFLRRPADEPQRVSAPAATAA